MQNCKYRTLWFAHRGLPAVELRRSTRSDSGKSGAVAGVSGSGAGSNSNVSDQAFRHLDPFAHLRHRSASSAHSALHTLDEPCCAPSSGRIGRPQASQGRLALRSNRSPRLIGGAMRLSFITAHLVDHGFKVQSHWRFPIASEFVDWTGWSDRPRSRFRDSR